MLKMYICLQRANLRLEWQNVYWVTPDIKQIFKTKLISVTKIEHSWHQTETSCMLQPSILHHSDEQMLKRYF
jgi:hypothetical protein